VKVTRAVELDPVSESKAGFAWIRFAWGLAAVALGLFLFTRPNPTAVFLVRVMALFWLFGGIFNVVEGLLQGLVQRGAGRGFWRIVAGHLSIAGALIVLANPYFGAILVIGAQYLVIAGSALVAGLVSLFEAFRNGLVWGLVALGILQLGIGAFLLAQPVAGILAFVQFLAAVAIIGGVILIVETLRQRQVI